MAQFTVRGTVPQFTGDQFLLPAENAEELVRFWRDEGIDTKYTLLKGRPTVKVRGEQVNGWRPGDRVMATIESYDRAHGRRVRVIGVKPWRPGY